MNEQNIKVARKRGMSIGEAAIWCMKRYEHTKNLFWLRAAHRIAQRELRCTLARI